MQIPAKKIFIYNLPYLLMLSFFGFLSWMALDWVDIDLLKSKSLDEYVFHNVLLNMDEGFKNFDLRQLFSFYFYLYGFPFFLLNYLVTFPFLESGSKAAIFLPRMVSVISMLMTWVYLNKILSLRNFSKNIKYLVLLLYILMPGVWLNATWFHPDFLMTWMMAVSIYFLLQSNFNFNKHYYISLIFWSVAISIKFQALMLGPIFCWFFLNHIFSKLSYFELIRRLIISSIIVSVSYFLLNPYLIHPDGMSAWIDTFLSEFLKSSSTDIDFLSKLQNTFLLYYSSILLLSLTLIISIYFVVRDIFNLKFTFDGGISFSYLFNLYLLLMLSEKYWHHYYLPLILFLLLLISSQLNFFFKFFKIKKLGQFIILLLILSTQFFSFKDRLLIEVNSRINNDLLKDNPNGTQTIISKEKELEKLERLTKIIERTVEPNSKIISSAYINLPLQRLGIKQSNNVLIYGELSNNHLIELKDSISNVNFIIVNRASGLVNTNNRDSLETSLFSNTIFESKLRKYFNVEILAYHDDLTIFKLEKNIH